jgi:CRISPR/Cas system-associated exonuclease Cas4 (RecB family)
MSLYTSASGRAVNHVSSSSLDQFRFCRRKFRLSRKDGWRQKAKRASLEFGKCIESAIQYHSDNGRKSGDSVEEFQRLWLKWSENKELVYTEQEGNHWDLLVSGKEMMRLYEILLPDLPIKNPKWQLQYLKPLWPGTNLGELEFMGYVDILSTLDDGTRIIIDVKTAKSMLDVTPGMMAMDGQLRKYAWVSGVRNVAFLNFVKAKPNDFKKGTNVTLLEDTLSGKAGEALEVVKVLEPFGDTGLQLMLGKPEVVQIMDKQLAEIKGKGSTEAKEKIVLEYLKDQKLDVVQRSAVTKTRVQFVQGVIPEEDILEVGQQIGDDMMTIKMANDNNRYPKDGGVRFPNAVCGWCEFNPICLNDPKRREETLYQIGATAPEKDWLTELEETE